MELIYTIAGLAVQLILPAEYEWRALLPSFVDFYTGGGDIHSNKNAEVVTRIRVNEQEYKKDLSAAVLLSNEATGPAEDFGLYETADNYVFKIKVAEAKLCWYMEVDKLFTNAQVYTQGPVGEGALLSWLVMLVYGQAALLHNAALIHASVVEAGGRAFAFLGKSGTGKSTHSRLWLQHVRGYRLLNDDNPVVRVLPDGVAIYGTPWSGKTHCYINAGAALGGAVRLIQAPANEIKFITGTTALLALLPSFTALRWNAALFNAMNGILVAILQRVPVAQLHCRPDEEAAVLCYNALEGKSYY